MRRALGGVALSLAVLGGILALVLLLRPSGHATAPVAGRTVIVAAGDARLPDTPFYALRDCLDNPTTCINGAGGKVLAYRVSGRTPAGPVGGTVLTDENCEPDRWGVSHCLNRIELERGGMVTVRHDHNMGNDPCLAPGERVVVRPLEI